MNASLTAFPPRGLSPHQFTPMSGGHKPLHRIANVTTNLSSRHETIAQQADAY